MLLSVFATLPDSVNSNLRSSTALRDSRDTRRPSQTERASLMTETRAFRETSMARILSLSFGLELFRSSAVALSEADIAPTSAISHISFGIPFWRS